jgi:hypothetical protein
MLALFQNKWHVSRDGEEVAREKRVKERDRE